MDTVQGSYTISKARNSGTLDTIERLKSKKKSRYRALKTY